MPIGSIDRCRERSDRKFVLTSGGQELSGDPASTHHYPPAPLALPRPPPPVPPPTIADRAGVRARRPATCGR